MARVPTARRVAETRQTPFVSGATNTRQIPSLEALGGGRAVARADESKRILAAKIAEIGKREIDNANRVATQLAAAELYKRQAEIRDRALSLRGSDAIGAVEAADTELSNAISDISGEMIRNEAQREMFSGHVIKAKHNMFSTVSSHARREAEALDNFSTQKIIEHGLETYRSIPWSSETGSEQEAQKELADTVKIYTDFLDSRGRKDPKLRKILIDELKQNAQVRRIRRLLDPSNNDFEGARKLLEKYGDQIGLPDRAQLYKIVEERELENEASDIGQSLLAKHSSHGKAIAEVNRGDITYVGKDGKTEERHLLSKEKKAIGSFLKEDLRAKKLEEAEQKRENTRLLDEQWQKQGRSGWRRLDKFAQSNGIVPSAGYMAARRSEEHTVQMWNLRDVDRMAKDETERIKQKDEIVKDWARSHLSEIGSIDIQEFVNKFSPLGRQWALDFHKKWAGNAALVDEISNKYRGLMSRYVGKLVRTRKLKGGALVGTSQAHELYLNGMSSDLQKSVSGKLTEDQISGKSPIPPNVIEDTAKATARKWVSSSEDLVKYQTAKEWLDRNYSNILPVNTSSELRQAIIDRYDVRRGDRVIPGGSRALSQAVVFLEAAIPGEKKPTEEEIAAVAMGLLEHDFSYAYTMARMIGEGTWKIE